MATITMEQLTKVYPNGFKAVDALDLSIADGEFMVLVGPSGCGKTTALRMVAGLEDITSGTLRVGGHAMNEVAPPDRDIAMVFQNYALYPHMTVGQNIGFALKLRKIPKPEIAKIVRDAAGVLGLTSQLNLRPAQLSGGQRQRVAMGRAIVREPSAFLMDEPLSNLDAKLRVQMRAEVSRVQRRLGVATIYVTHDQVEAMTMGDRVAVLRGGLLQQCDAPQPLYDHPVNMFVAAFIGSPAMNLYAGVLSENRQAVRLGSQDLVLASRVGVTRPGLERYAGKELVVGIRPEHIVEATAGSLGTDDVTRLHAEVELIEALGSELLVHFRIDAARVHSDATHEDELGHDESSPESAGELSRAARADSIARLDPRIRLVVGAPITFEVDTTRIHFFDRMTGASIWQ